MPGASLIASNQPPAPAAGSLITFVDRDTAAGLIAGFLSALEAEGGAKTPFMQFAQARAERQLSIWGVAR